MLKSVGTPRTQDQETDKDGSDWIDKPSNAASNNGHSQTKGVDNDVIAMIDEEDVHCRVAAKNEAVDAQTTLGEDCTW